MMNRLPGEREIRVLVVEDNAADAFRVKEALGDRGLGAFHTTVVGRLRDAVHHLEHSDVVLLDLSLPDGSGLELLDRVREQVPALAVVVLSGRRDEETAFQCLQHGAQDVLVKGSVDGGAIARAIRCARERKALADGLDEAFARAQAAEENFRSVLAAAREGVVVADPVGHVLFVNPAAEELLGWLQGPDRSRSVNLSLLTPGPADLECRGPDGEIRHVEARISTITWGDQPAVLATLHDETARKREEIERRETEERVEEEGRLAALGRLAGGVAHGIDGALGNILGNASQVAEAEGASDRVRGLGRGIEEAGWKAAALVAQLLASAGRQQARPEPLDLAETVGVLLELVDKSLGHHVSLRWEMEPGLPKVCIDRRFLAQALLILAEHGRDAMSGGGVLEIRVHRERRTSPRRGRRDGDARGYASLSVRDSGPGLDPEVRRRVLEPFYTPEVLGIGSGLGLAPVQGIARQCGGRVVVESSPGRGTTVRMLLPFVKEDREEPAPEPDAANAPPAREDIPRGNESVLLVEDDAGLRSEIRSSLQGLGYRVFDALDAGDAVRQTANGEGAPDLLIAEAKASGMPGEVLARVLRVRRPGLRAVLLGSPGGSGDSGVDPRDGDLVLPRPFEGVQLATAIRRVLDFGKAGPAGGAGLPN